MDDLKQDIRYALRNLRRAPLFALVVIATLALGIGANTAVFSIVDAVMLRPLPYAAPEQLTAIYGNTLADFTRIRELSTSWSDVAIYRQSSVGLSGDQEPERVDAVNVSASFFSTLGVRAALGRTVGDDASTGQPNVVVISSGLWQRRFGGDRAIIGKLIAIEGAPFVVVGVMPANFAFPRRGTDLWFPIVMPPSRSGAFWGSGGYGAVGRLRPGVTAAAAQNELRSVYPRIALENPIWNPGPTYGAGATVTPLQQKLAGPARTTLLLLLGAVGVVLLISCANVANLLLVRATSRRKEIAIRMAIGGGRGRLVRQLVTESLVLALLGGVAGAGVAWLGVHELMRALPAELARVAYATIDVRVLAFAFLLVIVAGFAFGIIPALRATHADVQPTLRDGSRTSTGGGSHRRLLAAVVSGEIAAAVLLITGAMLLIRTMSALHAIDPGFRVESLVTARITPPTTRFADPQKTRAFFDELLRRLGELPGVESVAASTNLPLATPSGGLAIRIQGQIEEIGPALPVTDHYELVTPAYLETMRIPVVAGRGITADDRADAPPVALISESLARHYWPAGDALGKHINYPWKNDWITIVGIVKDAKLDSLTGQHEETVYRPIAQAPVGVAPIAALSIVMRTSRDPAALASSLRKTVAQIDPATPVSNIQTMRDIVDRSAARQQFTTRLFALFAAIALLLGVVGIYGVMSYAVAQRQREIGVRMALGASPLDAQRLVLGEGLRLAGAGIVVGIVLSLLATRLLGTLLYGVTPTDPLTFAIVPVLLAGVALLASYLPARRATQVDPTTALRAD